MQNSCVLVIGKTSQDKKLRKSFLEECLSIILHYRVSNFFLSNL